MYLAVRGGYGKYTLGLFHERGPKTSRHDIYVAVLD